ANMDSVTGARMAMTLALEGGFGFVHRAMSIEAERREVERVKRSHGFVVELPLALPQDARLAEARQFARAHHVTGLLVETARGSGVLAGLLSNRDLPWVEGQDDHAVAELVTP